MAVGCDGVGVSWITMVRFPCTIATAVSRTSPPATMVPVRSLMTTRALRSGVTSRSSSVATKSTTSVPSGTCTDTAPPSVAVAVPAPKRVLTAAALGRLGLNPRELASVLEALRGAGALEAEVLIQ